jgi:alanine racemase
MFSLFHWLAKRRFPYETLIKIEISESRLLNNLKEFAALAPGNRIAPVLKSNAYGHGLLEVAQILQNARKTTGVNIPFFVVDSYFEAVALRAKGIKNHLLIIGYTRPETITRSRLFKSSFTVASLETLRSIGSPRHFIRIHLKLDTGMRRQGILPEEIDEAIQIIKNNPSLYLEGICSHLSDSDNLDQSFSETQIGIWNNAVRKIKNFFPNIKYIHLCATYGHKFSNECDANVSRLGIGLYGLADGTSISPKLNILPVLGMKTIITGTKKLKAGETVGYNNTFQAQKDMVIATIPVGYYEGLDRRVSNSGSVLLGSERIPSNIVGKVSMNITTIDITKIKNAKIGTPVVVISNDPKDANSINSMAKKYNEITYELAVHIPAHLKRIVVE